MTKLTEQLIRDISLSKGIWLDDDLSGDIHDGSLKVHVWFNNTGNGFEIVRQVAEMPYISIENIPDYCAEREIKTVEDLNKAYEDIFNLPERFLNLFYNF